IGNQFTVSGDNLKSGHHTVTIQLPPEDPDPQHPYILVVADPERNAVDSYRPNNDKSVLLLTVPYYNQVVDANGDPAPWACLDYLNAVNPPRGKDGYRSDYPEGAPLKIKTSGCALSDLAMSLSYLGIRDNPGQLNGLLRSRGYGYLGNGDLV